MTDEPTETQTEEARKRRLDQVAPTEVEAIEGAKGRLRYDAERRYVRCGEGRFETVAALVSHVADRFPSERSGAGLRGRMTREGKYTRISKDGERTFTFGDPILDSITDDHGRLTVAGREVNLYAAELAADERGGGIGSIGFSGDVRQAREAQRIAALSSASRFAVLEDDGDELILASRNPHEMWFYRGSTKMRFRAFRKSYFVYIKMGADIETWGQDFRRATITSTYGSFLDGHGHCFAVGTDSDSDTNDDYVDEYEWFLGGGVESGFDGVRSDCVATWHDRVYPGTVEYGCIIADI
jgi:hypothetical protein